MPPSFIGGLNPPVLHALMEHLPVGLIVVSAPNLEIIAISEPACQLLGRPRAQLEGRPIPDIVRFHTVFGPDGEAAEVAQYPIARACTAGEVVRGEQWASTDETGRTTVVMVNAAPIYAADGSISGGLVCWTDITALKTTEESLRQCVATESLLLRESNHRIKNHLQMLAGLIELEVLRPDITARELADSMADRLGALAAAHRGFYASCSPSSVNATQLLEWITHALGSPRCPIQTNLPPDLHFNEFQVTPVALAINEAISNALKHAYREDQCGPIHVSFTREPSDMVVLEVADEGEGLPAHRNELGLGTRILDALARQLNGTFTLVNRPGGGTIAQLRFPERHSD